MPKHIIECVEVQVTLRRSRKKWSNIKEKEIPVAQQQSEKLVQNLKNDSPTISKNNTESTKQSDSCKATQVNTPTEPQEDIFAKLAIDSGSEKDMPRPIQSQNEQKILKSQKIVAAQKVVTPKIVSQSQKSVLKKKFVPEKIVFQTQKSVPEQKLVPEQKFVQEQKYFPEQKFVQHQEILPAQQISQAPNYCMTYDQPSYYHDEYAYATSDQYQVYDDRYYYSYENVPYATVYEKQNVPHDTVNENYQYEVLSEQRVEAPQNMRYFPQGSHDYHSQIPTTNPSGEIQNSLAQNKAQWAQQNPDAYYYTMDSYGNQFANYQQTTESDSQMYPGGYYYNGFYSNDQSGF